RIHPCPAGSRFTGSSTTWRAGSSPPSREQPRWAPQPDDAPARRRRARVRAGEMMGAMRANLHKDPTQVASMFDEVSQNYDLTNDVLTFGIDRMWRRATFAAVGAHPGQRVLDLAAGTGTSSVPYAEAGIYVVPYHFSEGMFDVGKQRRPNLPSVVGVATALPFDDDTFDAVTISIELRNVVNTARGLAEIFRVAKPGG